MALAAKVRRVSPVASPCVGRTWYEGRDELTALFRWYPATPRRALPRVTSLVDFSFRHGVPEPGNWRTFYRLLAGFMGESPGGEARLYRAGAGRPRERACRMNRSREWQQVQRDAQREARQPGRRDPPPAVAHLAQPPAPRRGPGDHGRRGPGVEAGRTSAAPGPSPARRRGACAPRPGWCRGPSGPACACGPCAVSACAWSRRAATCRRGGWRIAAAILIALGLAAGAGAAAAGGTAAPVA